MTSSYHQSPEDVLTAVNPVITATILAPESANTVISVVAGLRPNMTVLGHPAGLTSHLHGSIDPRPITQFNLVVPVDK